MTETKQKWLKTDKLGRKFDKIWRKRGMLGMFCFCSLKLSNSFPPSHPILFCQFCSAKMVLEKYFGTPLSVTSAARGKGL